MIPLAEVLRVVRTLESEDRREGGRPEESMGVAV